MEYKLYFRQSGNNTWYYISAKYSDWNTTL